MLSIYIWMGIIGSWLACLGWPTVFYFRPLRLVYELMDTHTYISMVFGIVCSVLV